MPVWIDVEIAEFWSVVTTFQSGQTFADREHRQIVFPLWIVKVVNDDV